MQRIGFVVFSGYQVMAFAALSAFEVANQQAPEPVYDVRILSEHGGMVATSIGMGIGTEAFGETDFDTIIVGGGGELVPSTPGLIAYLRDAPARARRVASICSGAFALAEAGLLDGRRATTHWIYARAFHAFQARFPRVKVEDDRIFINDGPIWTSAGMSAGIDLALALVEQDLGADFARIVAKKLSSIIAGQGGSRNIRLCWSLSRSRTAFRMRCPMPRRTCIRRCRCRNLPKPHGSAPGSSAALSMRRPDNRLPRRWRICGSKPPGS